jgi:type IV pilus assembly protein PilW
MCLGNGSATAGALADGIDNMQILYGEDTDGDDVPNVFVDADNVTDWHEIKSVRIALLASTADDMGVAASDDKTHILLNTPAIGPLNDDMLRRVFTRTMLVRN